jgi:prepilin-type N-terminal cleavage/methylation domain-containing protein
MNLRDERGFTLLEIMISLVVFLVIVIGTMGVLGAAGEGGFFGGFPIGFAVVRTARDYTAASLHVQALHEFAASAGGLAAPVGTWCRGPGCSPESWPPEWAAAPAAPIRPYQLDLRRTDVLIQRWHWDATNRKYCLVGTGGCASVVSDDYLVYLRTTLTWQLQSASRTLTAERVIP